VLSRGERAALARLALPERPAAFLRAWTRKEAWLKALGTGLAREPDTVEAGLHAAAPERMRRVEDPAFERGAAQLDLVAPPGVAACLVAEGTDWKRVVRRRADERGATPTGARSSRAR